MERRIALFVGLATSLAAAGCVSEAHVDGLGVPGWTVILGGEAPDEGGYPLHPHCLYQIPLDGQATELYCPDEARWIDQAWPPYRGADELLFVAEVDAHSGIYGAEFPIYEPWVQELYRLSIPDGELHLLGHWLADSFDGAGPYGAVHGALSLGDGVVAVHWTIPEAHGGRGEELVIVQPDGTIGPDLLGDLAEPGLLSALPDGALLVRHADGDGGLQLRALDRDGGTATDYEIPPGGPLSADVDSGSLHPEPDGERVLLEIEDVPSWVLPGAYAAMGGSLEFGEHVMGWAGDGGVLIERDDAVWSWDGSDGSAPVERGTPDGADGVGWGAVAEPTGEPAAVFRGYTDSGRDRLYWYQDGAITACETAVASLEGEGFALHATDGPVAVFHDDDWESSTRNQVFACLPDGTTEEILTRHDLRGVLLPSGQIW